MPPKYPPIPPQVPIRRPEEEPTEPNDPHDLLCAMDIVDVLDAMPVELTKTLADLRELDAVLNATINHLATRLGGLADILTNTEATPCDRFQLLLEIAEELTRFKLGGEDKIRVAGKACDELVASQHQIQELISSSTLLLRQPAPKPTHLLALTSTHKRHRNSPMPARPAGVEGASTTDTPSKKKRRTLHATVPAPSMDEDMMDEDGASLKSPAPVRRGGAAVKDKKTQRLKAAAANRASPADSLDQYQTWNDDARAETPLGRFQEDVKTSRQSPGPSLDPTARRPYPDEMQPGRIVKPARGGAKKSRTIVAEPSKSSGGVGNGFPLSSAGVPVLAASMVHDLGIEVDENGVEVEADHQLYCSCQKGSYGEMIACDGEDCPYEWFHLACTNLDAPPMGDWLCVICSERKLSKPVAAKSKSRAKAGAKVKGRAFSRK